MKKLYKNIYVENQDKVFLATVIALVLSIGIFSIYTFFSGRFNLTILERIFFTYLFIRLFFISMRKDESYVLLAISTVLLISSFFIFSNSLGRQVYILGIFLFLSDISVLMTNSIAFGVAKINLDKNISTVKSIFKTRKAAEDGDLVDGWEDIIVNKEKMEAKVKEIKRAEIESKFDGTKSRDDSLDELNEIISENKIKEEHSSMAKHIVVSNGVYSEVGYNGKFITLIYNRSIGEAIRFTIKDYEIVFEYRIIKDGELVNKVGVLNGHSEVKVNEIISMFYSGEL